MFLLETWLCGRKWSKITGRSEALLKQKDSTQPMNDDNCFAI